MENEELQETVDDSAVVGTESLDLEPVPFPFTGGEVVEITTELEAIVQLANNVHALWITVVILGVIYIFNSFVRRS